MRWWLLAIVGVWSQPASACVMMPQPSFRVPRDAVPGEPPAAPMVPRVSVGRGVAARIMGGRYVSTSCDDIGTVTFEFGDGPPDGAVGYAFTLVSGVSPSGVHAGPLATREGQISWTWLDGATDDQEPFSFVVNVQTVSSTGARSQPVPVTVTHLGGGALLKRDDEPFPLPDTLFGDCGIAEVAPSMPLEPIHAVCLEEFASHGSVELRKEASLALIESAASVDNKQEWARLIRRHLDAIDSNDVRMAAELAAHLANGSSQELEEAIRLADLLLLERRHWDPETYTTLVYELRGVRAIAASALWIHAQMVVHAEGTPEAQQRVQAAQERVRAYSREWYRFAFVSAQPSNGALQMCLDAGGTEQWCTGFGPE